MGIYCCKENIVSNKMTDSNQNQDTQEDNNLPKHLNLSEIDFFIPDIDKARVLKIYDGDTITIICRPKNANVNLYKYSVRIAGIDCPEIRTNNENEKKIAKKARDELGLLLFKNIVCLKNIKPDKYGNRIVAEVWYENINISEWLIKKGYAVTYDGGKKNPPKCWLQHFNTINNIDSNKH